MSEMSRHSSKSSISSHSAGTTRGEEIVMKKGPEPGRESGTRTARDATSINPEAHDPIDPRMPHMPPA